MNTPSPFTLWLSRIVLGLFTVLMTSICIKFMSDPVSNALAQGLTVSSSLGVTEIRVAYGAFPASFALIGLYCLLFTRYMAGLSLIAAMMGILLSVRFYSGMTGHAMSQYSFILYAEGVFLALSLLGIFLQRK